MRAHPVRNPYVFNNKRKAKTPEKFFNLLTDSLHPTLVKKLRSLLAGIIAGKTTLMFRVNAINPENNAELVSALNRIIESAQDLCDSTPSLRILNNLLQPYGLSLKLDIDTSANNTFTLILKETPAGAGPQIEKFRRAPRDPEQALKLEEQDKVAEILKYEAVNPQPDLSALKTALIYFHKVEDWQNLILIAEKLISIHEEVVQEQVQPGKGKKRGAKRRLKSYVVEMDQKIALPRLYLGKAYYQQGELEKALEQLGKVRAGALSSEASALLTTVNAEIAKKELDESATKESALIKELEANAARVPSPEETKTAGDLQKLRSHPRDQELAKGLAKTHYDQVISIYLELTDKSIRTLEVLEVGRKLAREQKDWQSAITIIEKQASIADYLHARNPDRKQGELEAKKAASTHNFEIADLSHVIGDYEKAEEVIQKVSTEHLDPNLFKAYLQLKLTLAMRSGRYEALYTHLKEMEKNTSKIFLSILNFYLVCTAIYISCKKETPKLIDLLVLRHKQFSDAGHTFGVVQSVWLYLSAKQVETARNLFESKKDELEASLSQAMEALLLAREEKPEAAKENAREALQHLNAAKAENNDQAIFFSHLTAIMEELVTISGTAAHDYPALFPEQLDPAVAADLEKLRGNPMNLELAKQLADSHYEEVAEIYLEAANKPGTDAPTLLRISIFFRTREDYKSDALVLEKLVNNLEGENSLSAVRDALAKGNLPKNLDPETFLDKVKSNLFADYIYLGDLASAAKLAQKMHRRILGDREELFLQELNKPLTAAVESGNHDQALEFLDSIKGIISQENAQVLDLLVLGFRSRIACVRGLGKEEAGDLIRALANKVADQGLDIPTTVVHPFAMAWLFFCANSLEGANDYLSRNPLDYQTLTHNLAIKAVSLAMEGNMKFAQSFAREALNMLNTDLAKNVKDAHIFSKYTAVIAELKEIAGIHGEEGTSEYVTLIFPHRITRMMRKNPNSFYNRFDPTLVKALAVHLRESFVAEGQDIEIKVLYSTIANLNRVAATKQDLIKELEAIPAKSDSLVEINNVLNKHGFDLACKSPSLNDLILKETPPPTPFSELEQFRRNPTDLETALALHKKHPKEVVEILKYETLTNPTQGEQEAANCAMFFFWERKDWKTYIEIAMRLLIETNTQLRTKRTSENLNLRATIFCDIAWAYLYNGEINKARQAAQQISPAHLDISQFYKYFQLLFKIETICCRPDRLVKFLEKIKTEVPEEARELYELTLLAGRFQAALFTRPDRVAAYDLMRSWQEQIQAQTDFKMPVRSPNILWVTLCAEASPDILRANQAECESQDGFKGNHEALAFEAFILAREGELDNARVKAQQALQKLSEECSRRNEKALIFSRYTAVMSALEDLAKDPTEKVIPEQPVNAASKAAPEAAAEIKPSIADLIFRNDWVHYRSVFPKDRRHLIRQNLEKVIDNSFVLEDVNLETLAAEEIDVIDPEVKQAALELGITGISIIWNHGLRVSLRLISPLEGTSVIEGQINEALDELKLHGKDLRLAGRFLLAAALERLVEISFGEKDSPTVAEALSAQPSPPPLPEPAPVPEPSPLPSPQPKVEPAIVEPAKPEPSLEEIFQQVNASALTDLRKSIAQKSLNLVDKASESIPQTLDLIELVEKRRDQAEDPVCFNVVPSSADPLVKAIKLVRIYGPVKGKEFLQECCLSEESLAEFGFASTASSPLMSVVKFELDNDVSLIGIVNRKGDLIIPGDGARDELIDALNRTALECLARAVVPEVREIFRITGIPNLDLRRNEITQTQVSEDQQVINGSRPRLKTLPALVILSKKESQKGVSEALGTLIKQIRQIELTEKGVLSLPLFTRDKRGIYHPFPNDPQERQEFFNKHTPDDIYVQESRGYTFRLRLGLKQTDSGQHLLPFEIDPFKYVAAKQNPVALDLRTRLYFYSVLEYKDSKGQPIFVVHPKVSVIPEENLPPVPKTTPEFRYETLNGHSLRVHASVPEELVVKLLMHPEVDTAISQWHQAPVDRPPELDFIASPKILNLIRTPSEDASEGEFYRAPENEYFMIMPTNRGYYQGRFRPLSEYDLSPVSSEGTG